MTLKLRRVNGPAQSCIVVITNGRTRIRFLEARSDLPHPVRTAVTNNRLEDLLSGASEKVSFRIAACKSPSNDVGLLLSRRDGVKACSSPVATY